MVEKVNIYDIMKYIKSGIAIDAAPQHTGIVIWDGDELKEYYFKLSEPDRKSNFWEYKLRREFKQKLTEIVKGKSFEVCIIEDIYGGENYITLRELAEINTVVDELIFDGVFFIEEFYRWKPSEFLAKCRRLYKQRGSLKSKIELQGILEYLDYPYYMKNKDLPQTLSESRKTGRPTKKDICFEDVCDACGMLLAIATTKFLNISVEKSSAIKLSDIKMEYLERVELVDFSSDRRINSELWIVAELDFRHIKESIINLVRQYPNDLICVELPVNKLGVFGIEQNFNFYDSGEGYLFFYKRSSKK